MYTLNKKIFNSENFENFKFKFSEKLDLQINK